MNFVIKLFSIKMACPSVFVGNKSLHSNCAKALFFKTDQFLFSKKQLNISLVSSHASSLRLLTTDSGLKTPSVKLKKRPVKKKSEAIVSKQGFFNVVAYNTAKEYDLEKLSNALQQKNVYDILNLDDDIGDSKSVIYTTAKYKVEEEPREVFFFRDGSVVMWNVSNIEILDILTFLKKYELESIDDKIIENETEMMNYRYCGDNANVSIQDDTIVFGPSNVPLKLQKFTISNAMALSVNLGTWEATLDQYIESMESVTEELKFGKKIKMKQEEVLQKSGQLFALRHVINLSSDLLDTPDFYWDRDDLERLYQKVFNYFCINRRTKVMNEKLNHCLELVELLSTHLSDKHHVKLEWMIIILICVEVGFEALHYWEDYLEGKPENHTDIQDGTQVAVSRLELST